MAARAALAVDNAMLLADERAAARRLALLQRATAELSAAPTPVASHLGRSHPGLPGAGFSRLPGPAPPTMAS